MLPSEPCLLPNLDLAASLHPRSMLRVSSPPLDASVLEQVYVSCMKEGVPLGERLASGGLVSAAGLRSSLRQHNAEALAYISREAWAPEFRPNIVTAASATCHCAWLARATPARWASYMRPRLSARRSA